MIQSQAMQNGRLQIMHVDSIFDGVVAQFVGLANRCACFDAATGHQNREAEWVVITAFFSRIDASSNLMHWRSTKFTGPNHQRFIQQTSLFQILNQTGRR